MRNGIKTKVLAAVLASMAGVVLAGVMLAGEFDLSWNTIDGGGVMQSTGGNFELSATIGQPDAGAMTGGTYALVGGFWALPIGPDDCVRSPGWICDGDVDGDGQVNPVDSGLVQANFCTASSCTDAQLCQYDMDCDGQINPVDSGMVQGLFGTCNAVPPVCP